MTDAVCGVPGCPAIAESGQMVCRQHAFAVTAKALGIAKSELGGRGGQRCLSCRRIFRPLDWVLRESIRKPKAENGKRATPGAPYGYRHVQCDPPSPRISKQGIRESEKPLLVISE